MKETISVLEFIIGAGIVILLMLFTAAWISRGSQYAYVGLGILIAAFIAGYFFIPSAVTVYHRVLVVRRVGTNSWWMVKSDGPFLYNGCPNFDNAKFIWSGYWMKTIKYVDTGNCKSIQDQNLGVWWIRDPKTGDVQQATDAELQQAEKQITAYQGAALIQGGIQYARSQGPTR